MKQPDLGLDTAQLIARQRLLQRRAHALDERMGLSRILGSVGRVVIGGSVETGLMVWPDLDLTVVTPSDPTMHDVLAAAERLVVESGLWHFNVADHRTRPVDGVPRGIYLGPKSVDDGDLSWQIDIWFTDEVEEARRRALVDRIVAGLSDERRERILEIKQVAAASDRYHRGVSSVDLYLAVIEHGVADIDGFRDWLADRGQSL